MEYNNSNAQNETKYPPLPRTPLKISGVFGVTWQLFKRGFFSMLGYVAVIVSIPVILAFLSDMIIAGQRNSRSMATGGQVVIFLILIALVVFLFVLPALLSVLYLEMNDRMDGNKRTFGGLFRAISSGLKKTYSTYWAMALVLLGINIVARLLTGSMDPVDLFLMERSQILVLLIWVVIVLFVTQILALITSGSMIAAIAGNKRAFSGIGQAFRLYFRNFGHALGATMLYMLIATAILLILGQIIVPLWVLTFINFLAPPGMQELFSTLALAGVLCLLMICYNGAFITALFTDLKAREELKGQVPLNLLPPSDTPLYQPAQKPPQPMQGQAQQSEGTTAVKPHAEGPRENTEKPPDDHKV